MVGGSHATVSSYPVGAAPLATAGEGTAYAPRLKRPRSVIKPTYPSLLKRLMLVALETPANTCNTTSFAASSGSRAGTTGHLADVRMMSR